MSRQSVSPKEQIDKFEIIKKSFYIEAYTSDFYPSGVLRLYRVTRGSTKPHTSPYYYQSVRIKNPEELAKVKPVLDYLAGKLRWQELPPLLEALEKQLEKREAFDPEIERIVKQYPRASIGMLKAFDKVYHGKAEMDIEELDLVSDFMKAAFGSLIGKQKMMVELQIELLDKLGKEEIPEGMQKLSKLLDRYSLPQLATVTTIITDRLQRLRIFETSIQIENAYEIKGEMSVHNQLCNALWILDDSYWLLHSNEPLTNLLKKEYDVANQHGKQRPDFICASDKDNLVIVEIKRPSHIVTIRDINQLQNYLATVDDYAKIAKKAGFLIAKKITPRLRKIVDNIKNIDFKSYVQLVGDCRRRYQEYLDALEKPRLATSL